MTITDKPELQIKPENLRLGSVLDNQLVNDKVSNKLDPVKVLEIRKQLMRITKFGKWVVA
ncbi:MAG: hypothetical protein JSS83_16000 [Cyanobacteria bacterium SZAS LIN-3]|nr:hypothetical protein [Cyanobacteria bacterium SZAS LIN-3]